MKTLIASIVAVGVIATPAAAQTNTMSSTGAKSPKTMVTRGQKSTATTTATKVKPNTTSGELGESAAQEAKERSHARTHHKKHHHHAKKTVTTTTAAKTKG